MNKRTFDNLFWNKYDEEVYTRESTPDPIKSKTRDERSSDYRKRGKKEHIRSLRKDKRSKRGDVWGE